MLGFPEHVVVTNKPYKEVTVVVGFTNEPMKPVACKTAAGTIVQHSLI